MFAEDARGSGPNKKQAFDETFEDKKHNQCNHISTDPRHVRQHMKARKLSRSVDESPDKWQARPAADGVERE